MIRFCSCSQRSASIPVSSKDSEGSDSCKSCGGKLSTSERGVLMSTVGLELSGVIDSYLNWKTTSKGRQRAVRRPRTSFTGVICKQFTSKSSKESEDIIGKGPKRTGCNRKKTTAKSLKQSDDLIDKGPKRTGGNRKKPASKSSNESHDLINKETKRAGDMPVSESEKLGVSILGRHFSDTLEFVPVKKRRVQLVSSLLQMSHLPSHSDGFRNRTKLGHENFTADGSTNLKEINEGLCEVPDFSGISLLAAAACDSTVADDIVNAEGSVSKGHSSEAEGISRSAESRSLSEVKEEQLFSNLGVSDLKTNIVSSSDDVQNTVSRVESSSCNNKFNWDLNTTLELWKSPFDEAVNAKSPAADVIVEDGIRDENMVNAVPCHGQVGLGDAKHTPELVDSSAQLNGKVADEFFDSKPQFSCVPQDDLALEGSMVLEKPVFSCDSSVPEHNEEKECVPVSHVEDSAQEERQLEDAPVAKIGAAEETKLLHGPGDAVGPEKDSSSVNAFTLEEEKADAYPVCLGSIMETETPSSHMILSESASTNHASESLPGMDQRTTAVIPDENTYTVPVVDLDIHTSGCHLIKVETEAENNSSLHTDSVIGKIDQRSTSNNFSEETSDVLVERNSACQILAHADGLSGEVSHIDVLDNSAHDHDGNSKLDMISCLSDSRPFTCKESSNHDELSSGSTSAGEHVTTTVDMKMKNINCSLLVDENSNGTKSDDPVHIGSNISICDSAGTMPGMLDAPPIDGALSYHETCKSYVDSFVNSPGEVALGDHADCGYDSHASQTGTDQVIGLEKVELLSDDDSQYEDGEFRGSIINSWGEDEAEDGETECVDYGSDNREMDVVEAASLHFDHVECKNMGLQGVGNVHRDVAQAGKHAQDAVSQLFLQGPLITDVWDAGCGKRSAGKLAKHGDGIKKFERNLKNAWESGEGSDKVLVYTEFSKGSDGARESFHSASLRLKSLGWDQWPEGCRSSGDGIMDSGVDPANKNQCAAMFEASSVGESLRSMVGSTPRKYLSSHIERPKSSDASHRKDKYYVKASSSEEAKDPNFTFGGGVDNGRSFRRGRPSLRMHIRDQGDRWVDSRNHWDSDSRDSSGYYGSPSFMHPGSKNAVAAVAAKLESNGFVIAPDGTILKARGARSTGCVPRQSVNAPSQRTCHSVRRMSSFERDGAFGMQRGLENLREMSPDRHINVSRGRTGRYGPGVVRTGHRERYRPPAPYQQSLYRREQSFSPRRRPLHLSRSHSRSPSRSRTCSPMWTPPRESSDRGLDRSPGLQQRSRSPYFRSEVMQERTRSRISEGMRSPHRRPGFKRTVGYAPSARNHTSPPHASRRIDERNESSDQYRECQYRRSSGRRPHKRGFSQDHRFDPTDSPKRSNPEDSYRPMRSGRFPDSVSVGKGPRHDSSGTQRKGRGDEYKLLHSVRQYDIDGYVEHLRYDDEDGSMANNPQSKISS